MITFLTLLVALLWFFNHAKDDGAGWLIFILLVAIIVIANR